MAAPVNNPHASTAINSAIVWTCSIDVDQQSGASLYIMTNEECRDRRQHASFLSRSIGRLRSWRSRARLVLQTAFAPNRKDTVWRNFTTKRSSRLVSLHEVIGFLSEFDPVSLSGTHDNPLLHQPSVAWVEALTLAGAYELVDPFFWELRDEPTPSEHGKNLSVHLETVGGHHLSPTYVSVLGEGLHNRGKTRIQISRLPSLCRFLSGHDHSLPGASSLVLIPAFRGRFRQPRDLDTGTCYLPTTSRTPGRKTIR